MSLPLVMFDCDGTLVDSQARIIAAMTRAYEETGLSAPPASAIRHIVGLSVPEALAALSPELTLADQTELGQRFKAAYLALRAAGALEDVLYPGIRELLGHLDGSGRLLGVATGKSRRGLEAVLAHHGLASLFVTLQTADTHPSKPHPAMLRAAIAEAGGTPETCVMIGDTAYDMAMAHAAGAVGLGVAWGYHGAHVLQDHGAAGVAEDSAALAALIDEHV
ncbi:MAG: HAD-IA family hydrolase [Rhodothalassiaceae bacterium]